MIKLKQRKTKLKILLNKINNNNSKYDNNGNNILIITNNKFIKIIKYTNNQSAI